MNLDQIAESVTTNGGIRTLQMRALREARGSDWRRLSRSRSDEISAELFRRGYQHLPTTLPTHEDAFVYIYELRSPVGAFVTLLNQAPELSRGMALESCARALANRPGPTTRRLAA